MPREFFAAFVNDPGVKMIGVEAGGRGTTLGEHAATLCNGKPGGVARMV